MMAIKMLKLQILHNLVIFQIILIIFKMFTTLRNIMGDRRLPRGSDSTPITINFKFLFKQIYQHLHISSIRNEIINSKIINRIHGTMSK